MAPDEFVGVEELAQGELLTRLRDHAQVRLVHAHRAALPRLREFVASADLNRLHISDAADTVDGYLATADFDHVVSSLGLEVGRGGAVTLRLTGFDFATVRELADTPVLAAVDAATNTDPRVRGVGRRVLDDILLAYR